MKKNKILILLLLTLFSCQKAQKCDSIPLIIVATNKDTLEVGETYIAKVYLSDTSDRYFYENGQMIKALPVFRINDSIIEPNSNHVFFKEVIEAPLDTSKNYREWSCSVIFPHPVTDEGTVEIYKRYSYVIKRE